MTERTRIKICGLTREGDVDAAVAAGADAIGLVFYEKSPRRVTLERAVQLAGRLPPFVVPVGLFVNAAPDEIERALDALPGLLLQFHGDESPAQCAAFGRPYLRAARIGLGFDLAAFARQYTGARALLLDAHIDGYGGGGQVFDWSIVPRDLPRPLILSGGLNAANVADGIARVGPYAVDVSSGVESSRGVKDAAAMRAFCAAVRDADRRAAQASRASTDPVA